MIGYKPKIYIGVLLIISLGLAAAAGEAALMTSRKINRGEVIKAEDLQVVEKDPSRYPKTLIRDKSQVIGKETVVYLPKGTVLLDWMVRDIPLVRKGSKVEIRANLGDIFIRAQGETLQDGYLGKKIKVRNVDSRREIEARVVSSEEVEVKVN